MRPVRVPFQQEFDVCHQGFVLRWSNRFWVNNCRPLIKVLWSVRILHHRWVTHELSKKTPLVWPERMGVSNAWRKDPTHRDTSLAVKHRSCFTAHAALITVKLARVIFIYFNLLDLKIKVKTKLMETKDVPELLVVENVAMIFFWICAQRRFFCAVAVFSWFPAWFTPSWYAARRLRMPVPFASTR